MIPRRCCSGSNRVRCVQNSGLQVGRAHGLQSLVLLSETPPDRSSVCGARQCCSVIPPRKRDVLLQSSSSPPSFCAVDDCGEHVGHVFAILILSPDSAPGGRMRQRQMTEAEIGQFSLNLSAQSDQRPAALVMLPNATSSTALPPVRKFAVLRIDSEREESVEQPLGGEAPVLPMHAHPDRRPGASLPDEHEILHIVLCAKWPWSHGESCFVSLEEAQTSGCLRECRDRRPGLADRVPDESLCQERRHRLSSPEAAERMRGLSTGARPVRNHRLRALPNHSGTPLPKYSALIVIEVQHPPLRKPGSTSSTTAIFGWR